LSADDEGIYAAGFSSGRKSASVVITEAEVAITYPVNNIFISPGVGSVPFPFPFSILLS
jgi:hypothetical protein